MAVWASGVAADYYKRPFRRSAAIHSRELPWCELSPAREHRKSEKTLFADCAIISGTNCRRQKSLEHPENRIHTTERSLCHSKFATESRYKNLRWRHLRTRRHKPPRRQLDIDDAPHRPALSILAPDRKFPAQGAPRRVPLPSFQPALSFPYRDGYVCQTTNSMPFQREIPGWPAPPASGMLQELSAHDQHLPPSRARTGRNPCATRLRNRYPPVAAAESRQAFHASEKSQRPARA